MTKFIFFFLLLSTNCTVNNSKLKVTVSSDISGSPILYSILKNDTLRIQSKNDSLFYIKKENFGNKLLIQFDTVLFDIGELDSVAKSIHLNYTKSIGRECFVVSKVYNDVLQTKFDKELNCSNFNEIFIYNVKDPLKDPPSIKIRKKG